MTLLLYACIRALDMSVWESDPHISGKNGSETLSMANSSAGRAMVTRMDILVKAIVAESPMNIADDLLAQELINQDIYELVLSDTRINPYKARNLVLTVIKQVQYKPQHFPKFLEVLRKNNLSDLADMLENECSKYCLHRNNKM